MPARLFPGKTVIEATRSPSNVNWLEPCRPLKSALDLPDYRNVDWPEVSNSYMPIMKNDISIESHEGPFNKLIIDTKCYEETLSRGFGDLKLRSDHLDPIYSYLRTREDRGPSFPNGKGMLLYPAIGRGVSETIELHGHEIRIETIGLTSQWETNENNLLALVEI